LKIGKPFSKLKTNNIINSEFSTVKELMKKIYIWNCKGYKLIVLNAVGKKYNIPLV
jgi:hypothetical protein